MDLRNKSRAAMAENQPAQATSAPPAMEPPSAAGTPASIPGSPHIPPWLVAALLAVLTLVLYLPVAQFDFVGFDDPFYVTSNPQVQSGLNWHNIGWAFTTGQAANWHPLTWLSLMLDVDVFGTKPAGFHLTNIGFHALDTVLLFWLLWRLTGAYWRSAAVAALFAWHPLHVESVAWISERKDVLSAAFGFLTLIAYERYARSAGRRARMFYGLTLCLFALGLMSKPMLVTWPAVLLLLDYWPLERFRTNRLGPLVMEKIPFLGLAVVASVVTFLVQRHGGAVVPEELLPLGARAGNALISYCRYLGKMFCPVDLSILYTHQGYWPFGLVALAGLLLGGLSAGFWLVRERRPFLLMGWLWFLGTLVPVIGLVQVGEQALADRYSYIPSVGIFIIVVWTVGELAQRWTGRPPPERGPAPVAKGVTVAMAVLASVTLTACCAVTRHQLGYWQNNETLFDHALAVTRNSYTVRNNVAKNFLDQNRCDDAVAQFREALRLRPNYAPAHYNLGVALDQQGQTTDAIREFREAIRLQPDDPNIHNNLSGALAKSGQSDAALTELREAIRLQPDFAVAHANLAKLYSRLGRTNDAAIEYQTTLRLQPGNAEAHYNLGGILLQRGDTDAALVEFQSAVQLNPNDAQAHYQLGNLLLRKGRYGDAMTEFQATIQLNPNDAIAHNNLGLLLTGFNQIAAAKAEFQAALRVNPDNAQIHFSYGNALGKAGQFDAAIDQYQTALRLQPDYPAAQSNLAKALAQKAGAAPVP